MFNRTVAHAVWYCLGCHRERECRNVARAGGSDTWPTQIRAWMDAPAYGSNLSDDDALVTVLHPDFPGWRCRVTFSASGTPVGFEVMATIPDPGEDRPPVTARFLRTLPLGEIQEAARRGFLREVDFLMPEMKAHWGRAFADTPRPGRAGRDEREYAQICALYARKVTESRTPVKELAAELCLSTKTVRNIVTAGRERGLLTPAPSGRSGGVLTEKALALLSEATDERNG